MNTRLELASDRGTRVAKRRSASARPRRSARTPHPAPDPIPFTDAGAGARGPGLARARQLLDDERGAITAEYAVVIMAAVAFAGLLVAIMRSNEIRSMLVELVQNALGTGG
ncbi:DUF4244 domain-containing protein [Leucobacter tenebrionis]|uniref:DUF4244 domain-containing protein n=1 Tax=Leucobacter tenebrionis TaxID=2873270 RepID=UPI002938D239|nr:DUF4244 domain-containing protein [Leucobacter tenebrionis]